MKNLQDKISKFFIFFIAYTFVFFAFKETLIYTLPFVLAGIFALILKKPTKFLIENLNLKSWFASIITTIIFFTLIIIITVVVIVSLTSEVASMTLKLQEYISNNSSDYFVRITLFFQNILNNINIDANIWNSIKTSAAESINQFINVGVTIGSGIVSGMLTVVGYIPYIGMVVVFTLLSTYFFTKGICSSNTKELISKFSFGDKKIINALTHSKKMLINYLLSYLLIIFITFLTTLIGFLVFKVKYALILSLLCAIFDILPLIGIAVIYLPLSLYYLINGNYIVAIGILILYVIVSIIRQIVEPKIMSSSLGLNPIAVLAAMFIGIQAAGFTGMIFCMLLIVFYTILNKVDIM